jgi:hypothetical protein
MRYMYIYYFLVSRFSIRKVNFLSSDPVPQIVLDANVLMPIYIDVYCMFPSNQISCH